MTRFELLKNLDVVFASKLMIELSKEFKDAKALADHLDKKIPEKELQRIVDAAQKEGYQPLSFSFRQ